jgi:Tfp pilus assembly protein PilF
VKALPQTALVQSELKRAPVSKLTVSTPARKLPPAQQAALQDKLTLGGFFMDRQDFPAAIREFQAALAIDPRNHEAQAAMQQARKAGKEPESGTLP